MSTATSAGSESTPPTNEEQDDAQAEDVCPGCQEVTDAINYALKEHSNRRLWLNALAEAFSKINEQTDVCSPVGRLPMERDTALSEICARITRIARSDITDGDAEE